LHVSLSSMRECETIGHFGITGQLVRCCLWLVFSRKERAGASSALPEGLLVPSSVEGSKESIFFMRKNVWRAVIEAGFIIFLFYSNLLMGEFERSGMGQKRGLVWAIGDVFTAANFEIAAVAALIGYIFFESLRKRF